MTKWKLLKREQADPERYRLIDGTVEARTPYDAVMTWVEQEYEQQGEGGSPIGDYTIPGLGDYLAIPARNCHEVPVTLKDESRSLRQRLKVG